MAARTAKEKKRQVIWEAEIARRIEELAKGLVEPIPWEEAQRRLLGEALEVAGN